MNFSANVLMDFTAKSLTPEKQRTDCAIVAITESKKLSPVAQLIDKASEGAIANIIKQGDFTGATGQTLLIPLINGIAANRLLLVGTGKDKTLTPTDYRKLLNSSVKAILKTNSKDAALFLADIQVEGKDDYWQASQISEIFGSNTYHFDATKTEKTPAIKLKKVLVQLAPKASAANIKKALLQGKSIAGGMSLTRDLGNLPGNICTPTYLANKAKTLAKSNPKLSTKIIDEKQMKTLGMGGILSVSAGSVQPAKLIIMEYKGAAKSKKPYVLVGKGITFDSGGISLKGGAGMDEMKYDMCGAASVFGTLQAVMDMALPINLVAIVTSAENMPSGIATKPGDVITTMSGQTVEVLNTDAEGRLVLCDALTYAERFKPAAVIDVATLTGAIIVALGKQTSGLFSNNDQLAQELLDAGESACDKAWRLPIAEEYQRQLDSNFADIANIGGPGAGSITAACFLARFTEKYQWAHVDIAGTAWLSGASKGATGRPVPLLTQYLINQCGK